MSNKELILKYALQNAVKYNGKANVGAIIGKVISENSTLKDKIKELSKEIVSIVNEVNKLSFDEQKKRLEKLAPELLEKKHEEERKLQDLPNVKSKVVMRLAPFPSGPLHLGNARAYVINDEYAKKYKGKLFLVIDDTIGSEEKAIVKEAYNLIPDGLKWLDVDFDKKIIYKSDRLKFYYKYAEELIKLGKAYLCGGLAEKLRENRLKCLECSCRSKDVKSNLKDWKLMLAKKYKEGEAVLRIKTSMQHPNPAFRDRVLFRISERPHPRTGQKYSVWPLLEFSWAIDDHLLGITHVIRGKELMMESEMEELIWNILKWKSPVLLHTGLLQIEGIKLSKSKSSKEVKEGVYSGWDDPRTWSLQSLRRRGFRPEAIRSFCLSFGLNQNEVTVPVSILYSENRKIVDKIANRYFFIENPKKVLIKNAPKMSTEILLHPDDKKRGSRKFKTANEFYIQEDLELGKAYRFMHLFNFKNDEYLSNEVDENLNAKMIHWLPVSDDLVKVEIIMENGVIKKGLAESTVRNVKLNEIIQFERFAFCKLDSKSKDKLVFWYTHN